MPTHFFLNSIPRYRNVGLSQSLEDEPPFPDGDAGIVAFGGISTCRSEVRCPAADARPPIPAICFSPDEDPTYHTR